LDLFFDAGTTSPRESDQINRSISQFVLKFIAATPNCFGMEAGDHRNPLKTTMPQAYSLSRRNPATLLLVQPTQEHIELPMIFSIRMITGLTVNTAAFVNQTFVHCCNPPWCAQYSTLKGPFHGIDIGQVLSQPIRLHAPPCQGLYQLRFQDRLIQEIIHGQT
jgi:hypothetical protein